MGMSKKEFTREYLIRYYPQSKDRHTNHLIGYDKCRVIVNNFVTFARMMERAGNNPNDSLRIALDRGITFEFVRR